MSSDPVALRTPARGRVAALGKQLQINVPGGTKTMDQWSRKSLFAVVGLLGLAGCTAHGDVETTGSIWDDPPGKLSPAQALKATRDGGHDLERGKRNYRERNFGLAEQHYRRAAEKAPQDVEAWVGLAATYDQLGRFDLADRAYTQAIAVAGPTAEILNNQGYSYLLRGDYDKARKKLEKARKMDPDNRLQKPRRRGDLRRLAPRRSCRGPPTQYHEPGRVAELHRHLPARGASLYRRGHRAERLPAPGPFPAVTWFHRRAEPANSLRLGRGRLADPPHAIVHEAEPPRIRYHCLGSSPEIGVPSF